MALQVATPVRRPDEIRGHCGNSSASLVLPRCRVQHRTRPRLVVKGPLAFTEKEPCDFCRHILFNHWQYRQNLGEKKRISGGATPNRGIKGARVGSTQRRFWPLLFLSVRQLTLMNWILRVLKPYCSRMQRKEVKKGFLIVNEDLPHFDLGRG